MARTWILQANPKLYDVAGALEKLPTIYWRIPQYTDQVRAGDRALIWRAGRDAGFVGWGVFRADPQHYDLSDVQDPFIKGAPWTPGSEHYAPVRVWPGSLVPKEEVRDLIPEHRIVIAPMGTVFPLDAEDLAALGESLKANGYDLDRQPEDGFTAPAVLPEPEQSEQTTPHRRLTSAKITPALFLLSSTPEQPTEITIEGDALQLLLVEREAVKALDDEWDSVGVYLLIGRPISEGAALSAYVGKAQGLRSRVKVGHAAKDWKRCLLVQRAGLYPFNASDISWLERRLIDVLLEAPDIDLINKTPPPAEIVPPYKAEILERTVVATLGVLGVLGAFVA